MSYISNLRSRLSGETWKNSVGQELRPDEMTSEHCKNILRMIERLAPYLYEDACITYARLPSTTSDIASYYHEQDMNDLFRMKPLDWLEQQELVQLLRAQTKQ